MSNPSPAPAAVPPWVLMLRQYVPQMLAMIARGTPPGEAAAAVDALAPRAARWLEAKVQEPNVEAWLGEVFQHFPQLAAHQPWVSDFLAEFAPDAPDGSDVE